MESYTNICKHYTSRSEELDRFSSAQFRIVI